jgi:hypothetical protein
MDKNYWQQIFSLRLYKRHNRFQTSKSVKQVYIHTNKQTKARHQGDQIGRIFAYIYVHRAIVYYGQFYEKYSR